MIKRKGFQEKCEAWREREMLEVFMEIYMMGKYGKIFLTPIMYFYQLLTIMHFNLM